MAIAMEKGFLWVLELSSAGPFSLEGIFVTKTSVALLWSWVEEDFTHRGHSTHEILSSFRALTNEAERTLDLPRHGSPRAGGEVRIFEFCINKQTNKQK